MRSARLVWLCVLALPLGSCATDEPAPDVWAPPVPASCGTVVRPSLGTLLRWPYLGDVGPDSITIAWGTAPGAESAARFGLDAAVASSAHTGVQSVSIGDEVIDLHHARLTGLSPNTEYCYAIELGGVTAAAGLSFRTAPGRDDATVRFTALGDFGSGAPGQLPIRDVMTEWMPQTDLWMTTGDNAYGDGDWDEWQRNVFDVYRDHFVGKPHYMVPGNHDYKTERAAPMLANLFLPENATRPEDRERYWSFDWGPVHFIGLDSEESINVTGDDDMVDWLAADLAANDKPWTIMLWHHPVVTGHPSRTGNILVIGRVLPLVQEHGVDLVLVGHDHFYERFERLWFTDFVPAEDPSGFAFVITGGGGQPAYDASHELDAFQASINHFVHVEVSPCDLTLQAVSIDNEVIDTYRANKCAE